jgi:hypothetical protein
MSQKKRPPLPWGEAEMTMDGGGWSPVGGSLGPEARRPEVVPSLQLLFDGPLLIDEEALRASLYAYHPSLAWAAVALEPVKTGTLQGLVSWGPHEVLLAAAHEPLPSSSLEPCVRAAPYSQALKRQAHAHESYLSLRYTGRERSRLEQYVALAAVAGALTEHGAFLVLNPGARTSAPAALLAAEEGEDSLGLLRSLPLPILYCGFARLEVEGRLGVWVRTQGAHQLGLPDLACLTTGNHDSTACFMLFEHVLRYLLRTGATLGTGHTLHGGPSQVLRVRRPHLQEHFLESPGELFILEPMAVALA